MIQETYTIKLRQFEGPFDLLLFFIQRDELDINDIPIAKITDDFLQYVRQMESLNIDLASEFILVAATLMRIKAKILIPRKEIDEAGNEIDPRDELVKRLLEYKRYKETIDAFRVKEENQMNKVIRGNVKKELKLIADSALVDMELESLTLFKLMNAFKSVMERFETEQNKVVHTIVKYKYTIQDQQDYILEVVKPGKNTSFEVIFGSCENRIHAIVTFLGMLELLNLQMIALIPGEGTNNFWLTI